MAEFATSIQISGSASRTEEMGESLGRVVEAGQRFFLRGDLGGGKTTFVRGVLRGLGHPDPREVASPTFAIHHRYEGGRCPVDHLDLYRLGDDPDALAMQGVLDPLHDAHSVAFVEWPGLIPTHGLVAEVAFEPGSTEDERRIHISFLGEPGRLLAQRWHL